MTWSKRFIEVDMNAVQYPIIDKNWQSTKGSYSRQDVEGWVKQLGEIQQMSREKGYGYEDFHRMRNSADPRERSLSKTHHKFYDHGEHGETMNRDHVDLVWNGQNFEVGDNGNHRVQIIKDIGLKTMPAEVAVRAENMKECQKYEHTSNLLMPKDREGIVSQNLKMHGESPATTQSLSPSIRPLWEKETVAKPVQRYRIGR
jgi:hypothetical protein